MFAQNNTALPSHKFRRDWLVRRGICKKTVNVDASLMRKGIPAHYCLVGSHREAA